MTGRKVRGTAAIVLVLLAGLALAGCGAEGAEESAADRAATGERQRADTQGGARPDQVKVGVPASAVIHTGRLDLEVKDVAASADEAIQITEAAGGYVGKDSRDTGDGTGRATVTLRIPAEGFQPTIRRLARIGKELRREITAEDVSEAIVDLDSRITTMRASVKRTRALLARADSISDISAVERELSSREAELATLESRRRNLSNQVTYSGITVSLVAKSQPPAAPVEIGFGTGLGAGWQAFAWSVRVLLTILGAVLPFLTYALPVLAVIFLARRLHRRTRPGPASSGDLPR
ncbi:MAG TPA: DUF4349 domain-containing protein [Micromonosporaceae bacterium]|jgi:hypothetical protein|nr:DUF4349 domain-containing protein [Micromonosporaceae bacterium]